MGNENNDKKIQVTKVMMKRQWEMKVMMKDDGDDNDDEKTVGIKMMKKR